MVSGRDGAAQYIYLAQLQACKGTCKCNVCQLLRKSADGLTEEALNPSKSSELEIPDMIRKLNEVGYLVTLPEQHEKVEI